MAVEIERKFLVTGDDYQAFPGLVYEQGYLSSDPERTVRVRIAGDRALHGVFTAAYDADPR